MKVARLPTPQEIRQLRVKAGFTQKKLAELVGVTQAYIAKIESGQADPKLSTLKKILEAIETKSSASRHVAAGEIATRPVIAVKPQAPVKKAIRLMEEHNISQIPVLESGAQVGSISETTLIRLVGAGEKLETLLERKVSEVMEVPFPVVSQDIDLSLIYPLLEERPAVLVAERGKIVGILTRADIFKLGEKMR